MRSFDYDMWEYFGSTADLGWGPYVAQAGWYNSWIPSVLAMRSEGKSLFDLTSADRMMGIFPKLLAEMMPNQSG
ncbi:MAG: hypothetical protein HYX78_06700 [Armatimonadetes bacterium]|nr:hypothetical protein [Armatimonadota bacterium]